MANPFDLTAFDGVPIGASTDYHALLAAQDQWVRSGTVASTPRRASFPLVTGTALAGRALSVRVLQGRGSALSAAQWRADVQGLFDPNANADGVRYLTMIGDDGISELRLGVYVTSIEYLSPNQFVVVLWAPWPVWEAATALTSGNDPATVTNAGNVPVAPTLTLTSATTASRRRVTVTSTKALVSYPIEILGLGTTETITKIWTYVNGAPAPNATGSNSNELWVLVDTASDGTTETVVDVFYGANMTTNPLAGALDDGGMDLANSGNSVWRWNDWNTLANPARNGVWRPMVTGNWNDANGDTYTATNAGQLAIGAAGDYANEADSLVLVVDSGAGTSNALTNLVRTLAGFDGTNARAFVRYQVAGSAIWQTAWSSLSNGAVSTAIDLDNAVRIAIGVENASATSDPATLTVSGSGSGVGAVSLTLANPPTVTVGSADTVSIYHGTYTIGSRSITFSNVLALGALTIDCHNRTITAANGGPIYGEITFSDPDVWLLLEPGANTITDGLSVTDTVTHRDGWG